MESDIQQTHKKEPASKTRKHYILRLIGRCIILLFCILMYIQKPDYLNILSGFAFFDKPSPLHLLWLIWMLDMIYQLFPIKKHIALGSQKLFSRKFMPIKEKINYRSLKEHISSTTKAAYKVFILWGLLLAAIGFLRYKTFLKDKDLFMITVLFYVCDLICVLIWCPFRLIMKNRCCTTCRIFNWDHLMMFTPMMYIKGFFSGTLLLMSVLVWLVWELCVMIYPERFWEKSNAALKCSECTDKLCTQYCRKLR